MSFVRTLGMVIKSILCLAIGWGLFVEILNLLFSKPFEDESEEFFFVYGSIIRRKHFDDPYDYYGYIDEGCVLPAYIEVI